MSCVSCAYATCTGEDAAACAHKQVAVDGNALEAVVHSIRSSPTSSTVGKLPLTLALTLALESDPHPNPHPHPHPDIGEEGMAKRNPNPHPN